MRDNLTWIWKTRKKFEVWRSTQSISSDLCSADIAAQSIYNFCYTILNTYSNCSFSDPIACVVAQLEYSRCASTSFNNLTSSRRAVVFCEIVALRYKHRGYTCERSLHKRLELFRHEYVGVTRLRDKNELQQIPTDINRQILKARVLQERSSGTLEHSCLNNEEILVVIMHTKMNSDGWSFCHIL